MKRSGAVAALTVAAALALAALAAYATSQNGPAAAIGECRLGQLTIGLGRELGIPAGAVEQSIVLTNSGQVACFVTGWPRVAALDAAGQQIFQADRRDATGEQITLHRGETASTRLTVLVSSGIRRTDCPMVPTLLVTPPDETQSARVAFGQPMCEAPWLTGLAPGTAG